MRSTWCALAVVVAGLGTAAYAACCKYKLDYLGGESTGCSTAGGFVQACETGSVGCTVPSGGGNLACKLTLEGTRKAQCCTFTGSVGFDVCRCSGDSHPGAGWQLVGQFGDQCCWVKNVTESCGEMEGAESVNICSGTCVPV